MIPPRGFNSIGRSLAMDHRPALEKVDMEAIEKALSFRNCTWRFFVGPDGLESKAVREGAPLGVYLSWGAD